MIKSQWRHNQDTGSNGSPIEFYRGSLLIGAVFLFAQKWRTVFFNPWRMSNAFPGKRKAMRFVEGG